MIDHLDNQTISLDLEKPKRGRPATGKAMTAAEKQKAYRERKKAAQGNNEELIKTIKDLEKKLAESEEDYKNLVNDYNNLVYKKSLAEEKLAASKKSKKEPKIQYVIKSRKKGKRNWEPVDPDNNLTWESMEEATETVQLLMKGIGLFEYRIEPAGDYIKEFR